MPHAMLPMRPRDQPDASSGYTRSPRFIMPSHLPHTQQQHESIEANPLLLECPPFATASPLFSARDDVLVWARSSTRKTVLTLLLRSFVVWIESNGSVISRLLSVGPDLPGDRPQTNRPTYGRIRSVFPARSRPRAPPPPRLATARCSPSPPPPTRGATRARASSPSTARPSPRAGARQSCRATGGQNIRGFGRTVASAVPAPPSLPWRITSSPLDHPKKASAD